MIANYGDFEPEHKEKNMPWKPYFRKSLLFILILLLAAPAMAATPDHPEKLCFIAALGFNGPGPTATVQAPAVQYEQIFAFEYTNTLAQTTDMEQDGAAFAVRTEFSCECCGATVIDRPNGDGLYRGQGGGELFSSGFIV